jgi:hypothetical protein
MFHYFHPNVNSLRINPEMLKYLNEYTKNQLEESQKFALIKTTSSNSDDPEIKNLKLLMVVSLVSFLAGLCFSARC